MPSTPEHQPAEQSWDNLLLHRVDPFAIDHLDTWVQQFTQPIHDTLTDLLDASPFFPHPFYMHHFRESSENLHLEVSFAAKVSKDPEKLARANAYLAKPWEQLFELVASDNQLYEKIFPPTHGRHPEGNLLSPEEQKEAMRKAILPHEIAEPVQQIPRPSEAGYDLLARVISYIRHNHDNSHVQEMKEKVLTFFAA